MADTSTPEIALGTAVLLLGFNRPDATARVFERIREARPLRLYVAADGPRKHFFGEAQLVAQVRDVMTAVDWPCQVKTLFRSENLGCKVAVSSAITWFFQHEEKGIILEDDCLPSQSFFYFCETMLNRYMDDERIFLVSGHNKQGCWNTGLHDYFFSNLGGIWGWASWRRAWEFYDGEMSDLESLAAEGFFEKLLGVKVGRLRKRELIRAKRANLSGDMNSWAYPWAFSRHKQNALACVPSVSLTANIGFGPGATHTISSSFMEVKQHEIKFPIRENPNVRPDIEYDLRCLKSPSFWSRLSKRLKTC